MSEYEEDDMRAFAEEEPEQEEPPVPEVEAVHEDDEGGPDEDEPVPSQEPAEAEEPAGSNEDYAEEEPRKPEPPRMFTRRSNQHVTLEHETIKELTKSLSGIAISLFNLTGSELNDNSEIFNPETMDVTGASKEFAEAAGDALGFMPADGVTEDALSREGSDWRQVIESEHGKFGMSFRSPALGGKEKLTGADATYHMRSALGLSRPRLVACVHSGFWVEIGAPKLGDVTTLMQKISNEKQEIGRHAKAPMLSNNAVFVREHLIDFVLSCVVETNYEHKDVESLRRAIALLDYPALIMGLASTMWPNGYELQVPCIDSEMKCRHINKFNLFLNRATVIDSAGMNDEQKKIMAQRRRTVTEDDVVKYKAEFLDGEAERNVVVHDDGDYKVSVVFRHPTLEQHLFQGRHWVAGIQEKVAATLANASAKTMDEMAESLASLSFTREHSHWVKGFVIEYAGDDKPRQIDDYDDVMEQLEQLMENNDALELYMEGLKDYITDSTISVTGIPRTKCAGCGASLGADDSRNPLTFTGAYDTDYMIPIDVETVFFTLAQSKVYSAM